MKPQDFFAAIAPAAHASAAKTKIPASFTCAQAALESAWGERAPGFNLFGIKAGTSWKGAVTMVHTHEVVNGKRIAVLAPFRAYPDWLGSIEDHAALLTVNTRYQPAFGHVDGPSFARAIADAGYATDPDYAQKLVSIIEVHGLTALDAAHTGAPA